MYLYMVFELMLYLTSWAFVSRYYPPILLWIIPAIIFAGIFMTIVIMMKNDEVLCLKIFITIVFSIVIEFSYIFYLKLEPIYLPKWCQKSQSTKYRSIRPGVGTMDDVINTDFNEKFNLRRFFFPLRFIIISLFFALACAKM